MTPLDLVLVLIGLLALAVGAETLVHGAVRLAAVLGVSPLVVGLTVVAFGTGSPEAAAALAGAMTGHADLAIGNVVGSNIVNVLFILGVSAVVAPLVTPQTLLRFDLPLMALLSAGLLLALADGRLGPFESLALAVGFPVYLVTAVRRGRRAASAPDAAPDGGPGTQSRAAVARNTLLIAIGLILLVLGAQWLVEGAVRIARTLGVSEVVIGLTLLAGGTSLPELATSAMAAARGRRDIAVGNVVGSNIFNILFVLGFSGLAAGGLAVSPRVVAIDLPVMVLVALVSVLFLATKHTLTRREGVLLVAAGCVYFALVLRSA